MSWIDDQMNNCPFCGEKPTLGIDALNGKYRVACMNCCCGNMKDFESEYWGIAIVKWNNYWKTHRE